MADVPSGPSLDSIPHYANFNFLCITLESLNTSILKLGLSTGGLRVADNSQLHFYRSTNYSSCVIYVKLALVTELWFICFTIKNFNISVLKLYLSTGSPQLVELWNFIDVSEVPTASIFRVEE
jgi:hypothetical protein